MTSLSRMQASPAFKAPAFTVGRPADGPGPTPAPPPAPPPPPDTADYEFSYNSQDKVVFPTASVTVHGVSLEEGISVEKAKLRAELKPNADGSFVFDVKDPANQTTAMCFAATATTIEAVGAALGQPVGWAFEGKLLVDPDAGPDFNAYYSRNAHSTRFFHGIDPKTDERIMSGASGEVVSHETGHAILDGLRPAYFESFTPDVGAFHESFGDVMGILRALRDDHAVELCAKQTGGDLTKQNCIAATGEELGIGINDKMGYDVTGGNFVRNAINKFTWKDPYELPQSPPPDQLGSEVHNFSRLWTGAIYEVLCGIQARNMEAGMDAAAALRKTGEEGYKLYSNLMKEAPQADFTYKDMAKALVASDQKYNNGANVDLITEVMTERKILGDQQPSPSDPGQSPGSVGESESHTKPIWTNVTSMTAEGPKPLSDLVRPLMVSLSGKEKYGIFDGAKVLTAVDKDGSLAKDAEVGDRVRKNLEKLIADSRIRYNPEGYKMTPADMFDAKGRPYYGYVRWENGQMIIERAKIAT